MIYKNLFIFIFFYLIYTSQALRWIKYLDANPPITTKTVISLMNEQAIPQIDVSAGGQVTILRNAKNFDRGVKIYCFISGYNIKDGIEYSICKKDSNPCYTINDGTNIKITQFNLDLSIETNFTTQKGMRIFLHIPTKNAQGNPTNDDYSGKYFCKVKNNKFAIQSNYIEIRDIIYWGTRLFTTGFNQERTTIQKIDQASLPQVLNCSDGSQTPNKDTPEWTKIEFFSPVFWSACPVLKTELAQSEMNKMTLQKCETFSKDRCGDTINNAICPMPANRFPDWTTYINQGGDIIFTEIRTQSSSDIDSYSFMCYRKGADEVPQSMVYYYGSTADGSITKGISFDAATPASSSQTLTMISPQMQSFIIYARTIPAEMDISSVKPVAIYALFKSAPTAIIVWKQGETKLNSNQKMKVAKYSVTFLSDVTSDNAGLYTLEVTDRSDKLTMTINVSVLGPPMILVEACMIPLQYVWDGDSAFISCSYKQRPTDITLQINSQDIKLGESLENSRANLQKSYAYLEQLSFSSMPAIFMPSDLVTVTYKVNNLTRSLGQTFYQDHTITFKVENQFGLSVKSSSIYVIPRLINSVDYLPEKDNCTSPCSSGIEHKFKCKVRLEEYANKELSISHYWTINSNKLGDANTDPSNIFAPYFKVDPLTKELTMMPIRSNDTANDKQVKNALKSNYIECHFDFSPADVTDTSFSYISSLDKSLGTSMRARVTLDYEHISTAYVYWIVAVILGLIVLVIIIVLLTRYCMKNKGDVYKLDKLERKHGYDPDKEVQEEMFKPYERQEHDPEAPPPDYTDGRKLSITGHSVGSNDDGDLDNYELDPSNFNEDGSIIGKYDANPRNRAEMT